MAEMNQDYNEIAKALRILNLSEDEVQRRLMKWKMSTSGEYDPLTDNYKDLSDYEPSEASNVPPLTSFDVLAQDMEDDDKPVQKEPVAELLHKHYLPIEMYGEFAQKVVLAYSDAFQVNPDLMTATMLMGVAAAANKKFTIRHGNYLNRPCLWLCHVAISGYNKSEPVAKMLAPLEVINQDLIDSHIREYASWKKNGEEGTPPPKKQLILTDSTPEARDELLSNNGMLIYRDEIHGLLKDTNRYNQSGEQENYLSIWTGKGYAVNRKTTQNFYVSDPFLCICGGIQPDIVQDAFGNKGFEASGFIYRWLFLWIEDAKVPDSFNEVPISEEISGKWYTFIQNLWRMPPAEFRLDSSAAFVYQGYVKRTADIMNDEDCEDRIRGLLAKLRIYALRLALIIHFIRNGVRPPEIIDKITMSAAVRTCDCFEHWGRKILNVISDIEARKTISNADLLRELVARYSVDNQSELARLIHRSQQYVSRILNDKP